EHQDQALGHVFAAMVADSLDHRCRSGIANGEAFASDSIEKRFAAGGAVKGNVSNDDIFFGSEFRPSRRVHNQSSAGQSLAYVIVGLAFERKSHSFGQERSQALPRRPVEVNPDRIVRQARGSVAAGNRSAQHGSYGAVNIAHWQLDLN